MERAAVLARGEVIDAAELGLAEEGPAASEMLIDWPDEDLPTAVARLEAMLIRRALRRAGGNRAEAARLLNINRQFLYAKIKRYRLDLSENRTEGVGKADT